MDTWDLQTNGIFLKALEITSAQERAAYLAQACANNPQLRAQVESLLLAHEHAGHFLESPATASMIHKPRPAAEGPGTVIGPYKLLEQIGEGGFGIVFMAEQDHPIRRKVALKIIKPGMDTHQVIARFEAERQALALMDHPNIARVFDAGATASGRPYFVMELVKGVPITAYCDQNKLPLPLRLQLFIHVCQAVQHAHHKGIVHRDIKPSNILVTLHDGEPVVKVIDFGIAKAMGQELTDKTVFTGFAQILGTPLYASPEQITEGGLDIDTRTDVYSLGVLLYELLTGSTPFEKERMQKAAFDEMRRIIREEDPPRPSTRMTTLGEASTTIAVQRASQPRRLAQLFRGELDWIVMKALEKNRARRYDTPQAFAGDLLRYLTNEPVEARPPTAAYNMSKFVKRHTWGTGFAAAIFFLLSLSTILIWNEQRHTEAARRLAVLSQHKAEQAQQQAEAARLQALDQLADTFVAQGMKSRNAALWFAQAAVTANHDPKRVRDNLIRIQDALREGWVPVATVLAPTNERHDFFPGNARYLITYARNYEGVPAHVFDLLAEQPLPLPAGLEPLGAAAWVSGDRLLVGGGLGPVMLLSMPEVKVLQRWDAGGPVKCVAASGDGAWVAATSGKRLLVWSSARAGAAEVFEHPETISYLAFAQNAALLVTATAADAKARVFSLQGGAGNAGSLRLAFAAVDHDYRPTGVGRAGTYSTLPPLFADRDRVLVTAKLASGDVSGTLEWRQMPSGELSAACHEDLNRATDIAVSPDGQTIVVADGTASRIYDAAKHDFVSQGPAALMPGFDRTGKFIDTFSGGVEIRSFEAGKIGDLAFPLAPGGYATGLSDGAGFAATSIGERVVVYKSPAPTQGGHSPTLRGGATWPGFLPDGEHVIPIGITDGSAAVRHLQVFEAATGLAASPDMELGGRLVSAAPSPDGRSIATVTGLQDDLRRLLIWEWKSGRQVGPAIPLDFEPRWADYAPDGMAVAVQGTDGKVILVNPVENRVVLRVQCADAMPGYPLATGRGTIRFSHDGRTFFTWGSHVVEAWDRATGRLSYSIRFTKRCAALAESPDGALLSTADYGGDIRFWDAREGKELRPPMRTSATLSNVVFSLDGRLVCIVALNRVFVCNAATGVLACTITPSRPPTDAAFTPDARQVITAIQGGFQTWDAATGMPITQPVELPGNPGKMHIDISADGHWLALAGSESTLPIIDLTQHLRPADQSPHDALLWCELLANLRINGATEAVLSDTEWLDRWRQYRALHPETRLSPSDMLYAAPQTPPGESRSPGATPATATK